MLAHSSLLAGLFHSAGGSLSISLPACSQLQRTTSAAAQVVGSTRELATSASQADSLPSTSGREPSTPAKVNWDWKWVLGKRNGRKPAIKRPERHQWLFCNPNYDANMPLPTVQRTPYAPPTSLETTDRAEYQRYLAFKAPAGAKDSKRLRSEFQRFQELREVDWREAFQRGVAEDIRGQRKVERQAAEVARQDAWRSYKAALFERARLEAEEQQVAAAPASAAAGPAEPTAPVSSS